ncbi:acyl-CoA dehydrogenase [Mycolicibacterium chitae]|uniref:Acyl-CoA dehydrogenase n=1 Tax=Mycolicibacterium chitae TaxID=1792 RepID=A0A3S4VFV0_MYCCI|nr:acyl-CoA dehydrogenase family protein [Mycolicibacterium chitae]MCV7106064.1 acyl-CoA dehydrogenase family protein [Mycolicibacterium chitae]BBZ01747.1 acyl-CoA dehydrogenase [Mycolicibacterium chitae]VEG50582.1 acyl-CoA dehydrogenase [Mycolicibacterium chitae]
MDFSLDSRTEELRADLLDFMDTHVYPAEAAFAEAEAGEGWERPAVMADLKREARRRGLWNLFLPHSPLGAGLSNVQYAPLAEITGRSPNIAPEALNCAAPDTGNMELLSMFATPEQKTRWLDPLLAGDIRSAYCMTEPDVASSDASNVTLRIEATPTGYRLNGRKWWSTGVLSSDCKLLVVLGLSDPDADRHSRHSVVLVPSDTPGIKILRGLPSFGIFDRVHGGHGEVVFDDVEVGPEALLGERGKGFALGQARLGPGRIHHCMRLVGMAERALDLMCQRAVSRVAFGAPLSQNADVQRVIANARVNIDLVRTLVLRTAWLIDTVGAKGAATEISAIKIAAPRMAQDVIDDAIQLHGAGGLTDDYPLAALFTTARGMRFADGPEEVHRMVLARRELKRHATG